MEISRALSADLDQLTDALNDPDVDLGEMVQRMAADTLAAVPSFLGLSLLVSGGDGVPLAFSTVADQDQDSVVTSILLPLLTAGDAGGRLVSIVLYAARPGAFVDLAADLSWLTGIGTFQLDEHLGRPPDDAPLGVLRAESTVHQALGMLLASGRTMEQAQQHLDDLAAATGTDRRAAAETVLRAGGPTDANPVQT